MFEHRVTPRYAGASLALSLLLSLAGCGGGSSSATTTLSGTAMAGPFLSGQACAYRVVNGARGAQLGACANLASSAFSIDIGDYTGDVLIEVGAGATYDDEANPGDDTTGTVLTGGMRSLVRVASAGGTVALAVTPLTETALRLAGANLSEASVQAAINQLATFLPAVAGLDLRATPPVAGTSPGLAYLEMLRALSNMQWVAGGNAVFGGGLDAYLASLVGDLGGSAPGFANNFANHLGNGLDSQCAVAGGALSCTVATAGNPPAPAAGGIACDTSLFQPGSVQTPSGAELASFARTYSGSEGGFDMNFNFTASGPATMLFNADGSASYNGAGYAPTSYCVENLSGGGRQLVIHGPGGSHYDLRSDGSWSGYTAAGLTVSSAAYNGGVSGAGGGNSLSIPGDRSISSAASVTYQAFPNQPGKIITFSENGVSVTLYDYQATRTLGIAAGASGFSIGVTPLNACALDAASVNAYTPSCSSVGVTFDRGTGQATFTNTPMHPIIFTCPGTCEINGGLSFTPY